MALQPWFRSHPYKILVSVVLALIGLQYVFSTIFESRRLEPLFAINSTLSRDHRPNVHARGLLIPILLGTTPKRSAVPHQEAPTVDNLAVNLTSTTSSAAVNLSTSTMPVPVSGRSLCPPIPPNLVGPLKVLKEPPPLEALERLSGMLELGGRFRPTECQARDKVAVIIPYRDRASHLSVLLFNLHPMLQRQQLDYGIFVIEQAGSGPFNRAMLMNVGFAEALKQYNFDCFIFHDVDLLPEDDRNLYTCPEQPRHMSVAVDELRYKLPYADLFGGVSAMTRSQFQKVNGFSNMFWGWGGEDDDLSNRIKHHGYHISRYPANIARYKMMSHRKQRANPKRYEYLNTGHKRFKTDGLTNLQYHVKELQLLRLYTRILVELATPS